MSAADVQHAGLTGEDIFGLGLLSLGRRIARDGCLRTEALRLAMLVAMSGRIDRATGRISLADIDAARQRGGISDRDMRDALAVLMKRGWLVQCAGTQHYQLAEGPAHMEKE